MNHSIPIIIIITAGIFIFSCNKDIADTPKTSDHTAIAKHFNNRSDYRLYIGVPLDNPIKWVKANYIPTNQVKIGNQLIKAETIKAYLITYPNGEILDFNSETIPLPEETSGLVIHYNKKEKILTLKDLVKGNKIINVVYGPSTQVDSEKLYYSTSIKNISDKKIRIINFSPYIKKGLKYGAEITYTKEQFMTWYGQSSEWIQPGQTVTDHSNYGGPPCLWAYTIETDDGTTAIGGKVFTGRYH